MSHPHRLLYGSTILALVLTMCAKPPAPSAGAPPEATTAAPTRSPWFAPINNQKVTFQSDGLTLVGYLSKPEGDGPFPALISNHGSEHTPSDKSGQADPVFGPAGYVVLRPLRRGHGESQGEWIVDSINRERTANGKAAAAQLLVTLMETEQLDDQLAGLAYLKSLPYVDTNRLGVIGCSYGGIQTLLGAERGPGYKAAVAMSPAAESWNGNKPLQDRLIQAVSGIDIPVFLIHPAKDASLEPGITLGKEFERLGKTYQLKIYPEDVGTPEQQEHCFGGPGGSVIWQADVLAFFAQYIH
jgi:dienelactone hydrolase